MKYSQRIGILATIGVMAVCFLPWSVIAARQIFISGLHAEGTNFGRPGLFNLVLCVAMLIFFAVPAIWAKRTNVFIAAMNLAWAVRNYILVSACLMGECPEKQPALYLLVVFAVIAQVMTLLPKMEVKSR